MFATKEVDLGGGLNAIVRRPDFANWVEYEDLVNGRYEEDTEPAALRDIKQKHAREDQVVRAYMEKEGTAAEPEAAPKADDPPVRRKFTRYEARRILEYVQGPFLDDTLVALKEGEEVYEFIRADGTKVSPPPVDLRDVGPARTMAIANAVADFVRESRVFSFRAYREAQSGNGAGVDRALAGIGSADS